MKYLSSAIIFLAVLFEVAADILFKKWSLENKGSLLSIGLLLYFIGTLVWAYSLRFNLLSRAVTIFTVLNLILVIIAGALFFNEHLSTVNKIGILLGIISVILLQM